jgi:heat shock protein HslJ
MRALAPVVFLLALGPAAGCSDDDGDEAVAESFVGVPWQLSSGLDVDRWEVTPPSATFAEGTVGGSTGCNRFTASYTVDGDSLRIGAVASTRMACRPPADAVERVYLAALARVAGWRSDDAELVLLDEDGAELLRYRGATPVGD